jgi:hypothetical protein
VSTLMSSATSLGLDEDGEAVDQREYKSIIPSCTSQRHGRTFSSPNENGKVGVEESDAACCIDPFIFGFISMQPSR